MSLAETLAALVAEARSANLHKTAGTLDELSAAIPPDATETLRRRAAHLRQRAGGVSEAFPAIARALNRSASLHVRAAEAIDAAARGAT